MIMVYQPGSEVKWSETRVLSRNFEHSAENVKK